MRNLRKAGNQLVAQRDKVRRVRIDVRACLFKRCRHTPDGRDVFRAGAFSALLRTALDKRCQRKTATRIQHANALRAMKLMGRQAEHVNVLLFDVDVKMPRRLHGIGMERHIRLAAHRADFGNGLNRANLVVRIHDSHQARIGANRRLNLLRRNQAVFMHVQIRNLNALLLKLLERMQNGMMLKRGRNDVLLVLTSANFHCRKNRLIIGLAAT